MLSLDQFLMLMYSIMITVIIAKVIQKIRERGTIFVLELTPFRYIPRKMKVIEGNKIRIGKDRYEEFYADSITEEEKPVWKFWRNPKRMLLFNGITQKVVTWQKHKGRPRKGISPEENKLLELKSEWTLPEIKAYLKKIGVKARAPKQKGEDLLPIIMIVIMLMIFALCFLGFKNIGAI